MVTDTISRMGDSVFIPSSLSALQAEAVPARHSALVRVTHWITTICVLALLVSGIEILISHPRFIGGEAGNVHTPPLFKLPIPASRSTVPMAIATYCPIKMDEPLSAFSSGLGCGVYRVSLRAIRFLSGHFQKDLVPRGALLKEIASHMRFRAPSDDQAYNALQRIAYLFVILILFPLLIWTGLAMSPAIASAAPWLVSTLGGQQSARTLHFFATILLVLFLIVHVAMIFLAGFTSRMRAMITGHK